MKKLLKEPPIPCGVWASKTWPFYGTCKNFRAQHPLGAEIYCSEKSRFSGYNFTSRSPWLVDQSSPTFFVERGRKRCQLNSFPILNTSVRSGNIRASSGKGSEIGPNLACFRPQNFIGGRPQTFKPAFVN